MKLVTAFTLLLMPGAMADYAPYRRSIQIEAAEGAFIVRHSHDWSAPPCWEILKNPDSPFLASNKSAFVELWSKEPERRLWRRPSPALSKVWISPDGAYVVGLSEIAWSNPYQLVVYSRTGELLKASHVAVLAARFSKEELKAFVLRNPELRDHIEAFTAGVDGDLYVDFSFVDSERFPEARRELYQRKTPNPLYPGATASVSNWVWWYDSNLEPKLLERGGKLMLVLRVSRDSNSEDEQRRSIEIEIPNKARLDNPLPRPESEFEP